MNHTIPVIRRPRRPGPAPRRTATAIIATTILALPAAAFGGSPSRTAARDSSTTRRTALSQSTDVQKALAFARCMRLHGVRNWPDPNSSGVFAKRTPQQLGVSDSRFDTAETACDRLLPNGGLPGGGTPTPAELRKMESAALNFARCMRSHGAPNWPDYTLRGGIPIFDLHGTTVAPNSPQIVSEQQRCQSLLHLSYSPPTSGGTA